MKVVIVGSGISGLTAAACMREKGHDVVIYETRHHIGGNCYDCEASDQTRVHVYGPHIFHTNNERVWNFLNKYTRFNDYEHKVLANTRKGVIPIPFNHVSDELIGPLTDNEIRELLFVEYSEKMWGVSWDKLPASVTNRVALRRNSDDCRYFLDKWQGIPEKGYCPMLEAMAEGCDIRLSSCCDSWRKERYDLLVYTGSIDEYYEFCHGRLRYRTLDITIRRRHPTDQFLAATLNQCNRLPYTRKTDNGWWHHRDDRRAGFITVERPMRCDPGDIPFYPMPFDEDLALAKLYTSMEHPKNVVFSGRLARYQYLNMDAAVLQMLEAMDQIA